MNGLLGEQGNRAYYPEVERSSQAASRVDSAADEMVSAVSPVGFPWSRPSCVALHLAAAAHSIIYKPVDSSDDIESDNLMKYNAATIVLTHLSPHENEGIESSQNSFRQDACAALAGYYAGRRLGNKRKFGTTLIGCWFPR